MRQVQLLMSFYVLHFVATTNDIPQYGLYKLTRLDANPGLYFEKLHNIRFQKADWRVSLVIDINKLDHEYPLEYRQLENIHQQCIKIPTRLECSSLLRIHYIRERIQEASEMYEQLKLSISEIDSAVTEPDEELPRTIVRRTVPFGFVGTVAHTLFGILTEDDADQFNSEIDKLYADQKEIIQIVNNRTHIVISDLHRVHRLIEQITMNIKDHRDKINKLIGILNEDRLLNYTFALSQYASSVEQSLNHYISTTQKFLTAIAFAREGKLHPSLLNVTKLKTIINEIHTSVIHYEIPLPHDHPRIEEFVKLTKVTLRHYKGKLIITIHVPLVNRLNYYLYQVHSLPILQRLGTNLNFSAYIHPQNSYLGLSSDHSTYFRATEQFINTCQKTWHYYLCNTDIPLHEVSVTESCEISLLLRPSKEHFRLCDIKLAKLQEPYWTKLKSTGEWLYSIKQPETLQVLCGKQGSTSITIHGTGMIGLHPACIAKTRTTAITGIKIYDSIEQFYYNPNLLLDINELSPIIMEYHSMKPINNNQPEIWSLDHTAESLHDVESKLEEIGNHHREKKSHLMLTIGSIGIQAITILGLIIYYFWDTLKFIFCMRLLKKNKNFSQRKIDEEQQTPTTVPLEELPRSTTSPASLPLPLQRAVVS